MVSKTDIIFKIFVAGYDEETYSVRMLQIGFLRRPFMIWSSLSGKDKCRLTVLGDV